MARRDLTGCIDFTVLETTTGGDDAISEEVLGLFVEQAALWSGMLTPGDPAWKDAAHTLRGAAAGIGAGGLAEACRDAEAGDPALASPALARVRNELDAALGDVAAWRHELMLRSLKA
jgi:hypothetical protein